MAAKDIVSGTEGDITASGFNCDLEAWSAEIIVDEVQYRTFSGPWKKSKNVAYSMRGQFQGTIQYDDTSTAPVPASTGGGINATAFEGLSGTLTAFTGCTYTGTMNITGVSVERSATNRMTGTWRFSFDGQPSQTWDQTA